MSLSFYNVAYIGVGFPKQNALCGWYDYTLPNVSANTKNGLIILWEYVLLWRLFRLRYVPAVTRAMISWNYDIELWLICQASRGYFQDDIISLPLFSLLPIFKETITLYYFLVSQRRKVVLRLSFSHYWEIDSQFVIICGFIIDYSIGKAILHIL